MKTTARYPNNRRLFAYTYRGFLINARDGALGYSNAKFIEHGRDDATCRFFVSCQRIARRMESVLHDQKDGSADILIAASEGRFSTLAGGHIFFQKRADVFAEIFRHPLVVPDQSHCPAIMGMTVEAICAQVAT